MIKKLCVLRVLCGEKRIGELEKLDLYDLKTIQGKSSVMNRLKESVGQANHVLLNMSADYNATALARCIKKYFELNPLAMEVMLFKGGKAERV